MLIGFIFENYLSFFDKNAFSMLAKSSDGQFKELNTFSTRQGRLLKSAIVFGANGSGKSNFIYAFRKMLDIVLADFSVQSKLISSPSKFFFHSSAKSKPTSFEISFIINDVLYEYGFELLNGKVRREYLYKKLKRRTMVFERGNPEYESIELGSDMENMAHLVQNVREDTLFLCWANFGNNVLAMQVYDWFRRIQLFDADYSNDLLSATIDYIENSTDGKDTILSLLRNTDVGLFDFELKFDEGDNFEELLSKVVKKKHVDIIKNIPRLQRVDLVTKHKVYGEAWVEEGFTETGIEFESAGTRKLFEIAGPIISALKNGGVVLIDEIDARLHPALVRHLVMMFNSISGNPHNAQLICNTHDVLLLEEEIRRDQIYFTEKDEYGVSSLYSLSDFKGVRKDSKLLKQYLLGVFGATPKLRDKGVFFRKKLEG